MKILRSKIKIGRTLKNIYYRGDLEKGIFKKSIAIVGSRRMTRYGKDVVDKFVSEFVTNGVTTISGFMYGVDTEVHQKTVDYGGRTVAVFGCGLDVIYPPENEKLYGQILENKGLVVSEYEPSAKPHLWKFPQRNKIVAGLASLGVLVIEAGEKSGSLITANLAKKMGKKIYAVPGSITSSVSVGCNNLIKSGEAIMVTSASDILKIKSTVHSSLSTVHNLSIMENSIYKILQLEPMGIDEIAAKIESSIVEIGSTLSVMSLKGFITESGGKYYLSK
ncbi:MAG: DNA-processing protein DprA [Candidatus Woesebacteria bacterium]|nr:DNA-processing protein DprA [Candidatus Woesebacteria bacterium]